MGATKTEEFTIKDNSYVTFRGAPYDAEMNVDAIYRVRTSVAPLMDGVTDPTNPSYTRIFNVETLLSLKGSLLTPAIKLNFEIPELNTLTSNSSEIDNRIRQIKSDEPELNKQVVALIAVNRFIPVNQGFTGGNPTSSSVSELVADQVNRVLAPIGLTLGADVRGQNANSYRANLELLNRRINVSANYDQNVSRNATYNAELAYKIKEDGSLSAKASSRSSNNPVLQNDNVNTFGLGIFFKKEFNSLKDIFRKKRKKDVKAQ